MLLLCNDPNARLQQIKAALLQILNSSHEDDLEQNNITTLDRISDKEDSCLMNLKVLVVLN